MTVDEWDDRWNRIFNEARIKGVGQTDAIEVGSRETELRFGPRPEESRG